MQALSARYTCACVRACVLQPAESSLTVFAYLQICNYLSLSAFHICLLRGSSRSVCLCIAFEGQLGVLCTIVDLEEHDIQALGSHPLIFSTQTHENYVGGFLGFHGGELIPKDKRIQSLMNCQQVPNSRLCLLDVANCCLQASMGSLQKLTDSVADHLDPNVPYGDRLRSGGFSLPTP